MRKTVNNKISLVKPALLVLAFLLTLTVSTHAQLLGQEGRKLVGTGAIGYSPQGSAVAVSADGNTMIVGSDQENGNVGAVWFYSRTGVTWVQQGLKITGSDAVGTPHQGYSVSISADGNTAVVGGYLDSNPMGAATVYTRSNGIWSQQGPKLVGTGSVTGSIQGWSVAISGDGNTIMVGGQGDNNYQGAVWAFTRSAGVWTQQGAKITASGTLGTAAVGQSVSLSHDGNTAIVGAKNDNGNTGSAFVFTRTAGVWSQPSGKLVGTNAVGQAWQGIAVSISGDGNTAIVGGYLDNSHIGAAWIFTRSGDNWAQQGSKLLANDATGPVQQGYSVSLSYDGNRALVGGWNDNTAIGCAWLYTRSAGVWTQSGGKMRAGDQVGVGKFGTGAALSADGNTAVFGAPYDNSSIGAAWAFSACTTDPPKAAITGALVETICAGYRLTVSDTSSVGKFISSYSWSDGSTTATSNPVLAPGTYTVTITNSCGYSATVSQVITTVNASPVTTITGGSYFCTGSATILTASDAAGTAGPLTYNWSDGSTLATSNPISTVGTYSVSITNGIGCTVSASQVMASHPISVSATYGTAACYPTLKAGFDAINNGTHTGAVTILVYGNSTETASAVLNESGNGAAYYTSILLQPAGGAARTITGVLSNTALVEFNGADNVTIDGLNTNGNSLSLVNTSPSTVIGTATIRLLNDASNNSIIRATILGNAGIPPGVIGGGTIVLGNGAFTGNDNNTISYCNIGSSNATSNATRHIYAGGTLAAENNGLVIDHNNITDYFRGNANSAAIDVTTGSSEVTISNNKFYQAQTKTFTGINLYHRAININNASGTGYQVLHNRIGYADSLGTGKYVLTFSNSASTVAAFVPVYVNAGTAAASSVQGNTIAGITLSGNTGGITAAAPFKGIYVANGQVNVGDITGNNIGDSTANGSITYTSTGAASDFTGIYVNSSSNCKISNNSIAGITVSSGNITARNFYGIRLAGNSNSFICNNNTVGGSLAHSISNTATAAAAKMNGILSTGSTGAFSGNTIRNLSTSGGTGTGTNAAITGMSIAGAANQTITQNTIYNLGTTSLTVKELTGIQIVSSALNTVERNFLYAFSTAPASPGITLNGIRIDGGTGTYTNNMIALGAGITAPANCFGFNETSGQNSLLNNSVFIGGAPLTGTATEISAAMISTLTTNTRSILNNIFANSRSNEGTASSMHYSISLRSTTGLTLNNNLYHVTGAGGFVGSVNSTNATDITAWQIFTGQDASSLYGNPGFTAATATLPDLHINPAATSMADAGGTDAGNLTDFDGEARALLTPNDIGADAFISNACLWTGAINTLWSNAGNWSCGVIPSAVSNVTIPAAVAHMPLVDITDATCNDISITTGAALTISAGNILDLKGAALNNGTFTVAGKVIFSGGGQTIPAGAYAQLQIAGTGTKILGGAVSVSNELLLSGSLLSLGAHDLQLSAAASITGGSALSYIVTGTGALKQQGIGNGSRTGAVSFPVGTDVSYTPLVLNNAGTADEFSVRVIAHVFDTYDGSDLPTGTAETANSVDRTWLVKEAIPGGSDVTLSLQWNMADELPGFNRAAGNVSHYTNNYWHPGTMNIAAGTDPFTLSRSGITSFSPFAVGSMNSVLPLQLLSFTGQQLPGNILLQWTTANEINVAGFDIERSVAGGQFAAIGTVKAGAQGYQHSDAAITAGTRYFYRLKIKDNNGTYRYSQVISFMPAAQPADRYLLYPNPAVTNDLYLKPLAGNSPIQVEITDMMGHQWFSGKPANGNGVLQVRVNHLPSGIYSIKISDAKGETIQVNLFTVVR